MIPRTMWQDGRLRATDLRLFCVLMGFATRVESEKPAYAFEPIAGRSVAEIAELVGARERTVQSGLGRLQTFGLVKVQRWPGRGKMSNYDINPAWSPKGEAGVHPLQAGKGEAHVHPSGEKECTTPSPITSRKGEAGVHPHYLQTTAVQTTAGADHDASSSPRPLLQAGDNGDGQRPDHPQCSDPEMERAWQLAKREDCTLDGFREAVNQKPDLTAYEIRKAIEEWRDLIRTKGPPRNPDLALLGWLLKTKTRKERSATDSPLHGETDPDERLARSWGRTGTLDASGRVNW